MLEELKQRVYEANMQLPVHGLVTFTWGNVSEIDRETGYFAIKPSGVPYEKLKPEDMVIMDLNGNKIEGNIIHPPILRLILNFTKHFRKSAVLCILTRPMQQAGHRQEETSHATVPLMQTIFMEKSHVSDVLQKKKLTRHMSKIQVF